MILRLFMILIGVIFFLPLVFSNFGDYINFYDVSLENSTYLVSYDFDFNGNFTQEDYFVVELHFQGVSQGEVCNKQIKTSQNSVFKKITCDFDYLGEGNYLLKGSVLRDNSNIFNFSSNFYQGNGAFGYYDFEVQENNMTRVKLILEGDMRGAKVYSSIPKEVIPLLNSQNRDSLVISTKPYEIIEEDPLIAWNIERIPDTIEYNINKTVSYEDQENFRLNIEESKTFTLLKFLAGLGIVVILFLLLSPIIRNRR